MSSPSFLRRSVFSPFVIVLFAIAALFDVACAQTHPAGSAVREATDATASEARLLSNTRRLTFEGRRAGEGYFNRDGTRFIFQGQREPDNPFDQIYLLDLQTGDTQRITPGNGKATCSWFHPSANKVLFASTHEDPQALDKQKAEIELRARGEQKRYTWDYDETYEIYEKDLASGTMRKLTDAGGYDAEGSWSPDGKLVVFSSNRHAYATPLPSEDAKKFELDKSLMVDIYIMKADGSEVHRLTQTKGYDGGPFFSPDGKRICWRRFSEDSATAEVYTMDLDGSDVRQITRMGAMSWAPYYHPSGEYFIFTTNKHGYDNFELYLVDVEGRRDPVRVTYTPGFDGLPAFSFDGMKLAWTSIRTANKQAQLFLADWNHPAARQLLGLDVAGRRDVQTLSAAAPSNVGATHPEISAADARLYVEYLASDELEGRLTGTDGERLATEYVASAFERLGLLPAGNANTFFQEFDFTAGVSLGAENSFVVSPHGDGAWQVFNVDVDWRPLAFSRTGARALDSAEVVFAGYGIVAPKSEQFEEYDSYAHLDVKDRWVMVFRYMPEGITPEHRQHLGRFSSLRYKAMVARDKGARGLLVVSGPNSNVREQLVPMKFDASLAGSSLPAISMTDSVAQHILGRQADRDLRQLQTDLDRGEPMAGFTVPACRMMLSIDIQKVTKQGRNVLARLPAGPEFPSQSALVIGAHIDHLGRGGGSNSLARDDEMDAIHYGADDNASGIAGLLEIAQHLAHEMSTGKLKLKRDIIFAAWSGEELGLLGSNHYVTQMAEQSGDPSNIRSRVAAYLNMDMIGRLDKQLIVQGVGSSSLWPGEIEKRNAPLGLPIALQNDSYLPTDATSFYLKGVPILAFFTGAHAEYHTPRDTPEKLNYGGLEKTARFVALIARSLATGDAMPDYVVMTKPDSAGPRAGLRAYLGTIPDYADTKIPGLKLAGAGAGGPADKAGLKGGDIIVELAGRKIENIYDYTYAIDALKIGQPAPIVVLRGNERLTLTITPGSRE